MKRFILSTAAAAILAAPLVAFAHGVTGVIVDASKAKAAKFTYAAGEPAAYVDVLVFGPKSGGVEFQNGRTDAHGRFVFLPDSDGRWTALLNDGMGHLGEVNFDVAMDMAGATAPPVTANNGALLPAVAGVSLLLNFFLLYGLARRRKAAG